MTILTREQIDAADTLWNPGALDSLLDTARAYHRLRDAVLALHSEIRGETGQWCRYCGQDYPCPDAAVVARVDGSGNGAGAVADGAP